MNTKIIYKLPGLSNLFSDVHFLYLGVDVWIVYSFSQEFEEEWYNSGLIFRSIKGFKKHGEYYSVLAGNYEDTYDSVVEILQSDWLTYMREKAAYFTPPDVVRHFALYLDSDGLYEFCCENFEALPIRSGNLNLKDYSIDKKLGLG